MLYCNSNCSLTVFCIKQYNDDDDDDDDDGTNILKHCSKYTAFPDMNNSATLH